MKKGLMAAGALLAAVAFIGQTASAKSLEDVLKEKGVITEADYKEVTKSKPLDYKIGKGFTFTSADEKFQLSLGSRMQIRYSFFDKDLNNVDSSQFTIGTSQIWFTGYAFSKDLTYNLRINVSQLGTSNTKFLETAYMKYRLIDEVQILAGQNKLPFGRQNLVGVGGQQFVAASPATSAFAPGYDLGAALTGSVLGGIINYDLYGSNGAGATTTKITNSANDMAFTARLEVNPLGSFGYAESDTTFSKKPLVTVGANYHRNTLKKTAATTFETNNLGYTTGWLANTFNVGLFNASEKVDIDLVNADIAFKWMGAFAQAEYFWGEGKGKTTGGKAIAQGYYVQGGYTVIPKTVELAMRYSYLDPNRSHANDTQTEVLGGVNYFINGHNLKIQADIGNIHSQRTSGGPTNDMQYRLQATLVF